MIQGAPAGALLTLKCLHGGFQFYVRATTHVKEASDGDIGPSMTLGLVKF
jgi:hypothetical protein